MRGKVISLHGKKRWLLAAVAVLLAILIVTGILLWSRREGVTKDRPEVTEIYGVPVHTVLISDTLPGRPGIKREVKFIVIHETGNPSQGADAKAHSDYLLSGGEGTTSWHYTVDDHEIYHHIPDSEVSWNAGDQRREPGGNMNGISIELCVNSDGDFEKTFENGARLTAYLLKAYDLELDAVKQHHDFNGKNCPQTIRESGRWEEFLERVERWL
ncbi:MAG TPA: N-acetylmuramoyl-L-alanine amidase [Candidatus Fimivicinus intestinavium]|nr:N-acetylmuramoyl-L-alanine amidase [Candidatus Fimivicinus intestinavium]